MRVYHFLNEKYGLDDLREKRLKVSEIMDLNDPFELLGVNLSDSPLRKKVKSAKMDLSKKKGLICFSRAWRNPVQWAHYSDKHKGLCIGFEVPDERLMKVNYVSKRLKPPKEKKVDEQFMMKLYLTKFTHWRYEQEHREFVELKKKRWLLL